MYKRKGTPLTWITSLSWWFLVLLLWLPMSSLAFPSSNSFCPLNSHCGCFVKPLFLALTKIQLPWLPLLATRVPLPFHIHAKRNFDKKRKFSSLLARFEHSHSIAKQVHNQFNQFMFCDNSCTSRNIISRTTVKHIIKITHNLAYIGLEPKFSQHNQVLSTNWASTSPHHKG